MSHGDISAPIKVAANKFLPRPFDEPHSRERYSGAFSGFRIGGSQILLSNTPPTPGGGNPQFSPPFFYWTFLCDKSRVIPTRFYRSTTSVSIASDDPKSRVIPTR